jgi:hypothetical protein
MAIVEVDMHPLEPLAQYPRGSTFAERISELYAHKTAVAIFVAQKFLGAGTSAFISDGSSTFYVGLEIFLQARGSIRLCTNHLAIAHEFALWPQPQGLQPLKLELSGGEVNRDLMMVGGVQAQKAARRVSPEVQFAILSARLLFGREGPVGYEFESLLIKQAATASPRPTVIVLADFEKLSQPFEDTYPRVYSPSTEWLNTVSTKTNLYVISTCRPDVDHGREDGRVIKHPQNPKEHYITNRALLELSLGERFIEVCPRRPQASDRVELNTQGERLYWSYYLLATYEEIRAAVKESTPMVSDVKRVLESREHHRRANLQR